MLKPTTNYSDRLSGTRTALLEYWSGLDYPTKLIYLFGLVYFAQGVGQAGGLIAQPLAFYFKEALGFNESQTTNYLAVLTIPWMIKPLYGLISDFIPLFGYRRKTWLLAVNSIAALAFLWLSGLSDAEDIVTTLIFTALGTAASDVIIDAIMVESGKETGMTARFQSVQWLWFNVASIITALLGGFLCTLFKPGTALHVAALITLAAPLAVMAASWLTVKEEKTPVNLDELKETAASLVKSFRSRTLWAVAGFLAFWNFSPSFGAAWYYHMTNTLGFSQSFIGVLGAVASVGSVAGAWLYGKYFSARTMRYQLVFSIIAGTMGTLAYFLLLTPSPWTTTIAVTTGLVFGAAGMIALLSTLTLAAKACPDKSEGFAFAALMSVTNGVAQLSAIIGAWLYTYVFHSFTPLILISALTTLACLLLLPLLRGVPEKQAET